jgi:hypothetical protein
MMSIYTANLTFLPPNPPSNVVHRRNSSNLLFLIYSEQATHPNLLPLR